MSSITSNLSEEELLGQWSIMNFNKQPTFLIIGRGFIYPKHKEAIESVGGKILEVVDGEDWWGEKIVKSEAEYIVILTPNHTHKQIIDVALKSGKKVLCEKPLVLSSKECEELIGKPVYTVHQLRYLTFNDLEYSKNIDLNISVHRDEHYFNSWKGSRFASGGLLFNVGIHYFDLIIHHFGEPKEVKLEKYAEERAEGTLIGENYKCHFLIDLLAPVDKQERSLTVGGMKYELNSKENLHIKVYQDILSGKGLTPEEALKSIKLIENLK